MESKQQFTINIKGKKILCNKQLTKMSTFLNNLLFLGANTFDLGLEMAQNQQEEQIHIQLVDEETFMRFVEFCELNDFKQPAILTPVKCNNLENYLDEKNFNFISKFEIGSGQILALKDAAQFLGCILLIRLIAVKYAALIYFDDSAEAYAARCQQLGISPDIHYEDVEKYKQLHPCMNA